MRDTRAPDGVASQPALAPVASYTHTLGLLILIATIISISFALQSGTAHVHTPNAQTAHSAQPADRTILPSLLESLAFDWSILWYVRGGVSHSGSSLLKLSGRSWSGPSDALHDLLIAAPFWIVWQATALGVFTLLAHLVRGPAIAPDNTFPVRGPFEIPVWVAVSLSSGFCEELIFRGYLQRQFSALTGRLWLGVLLQAIVFGLIHPRGWRAVIVISVLGMLYGTLAASRQNLRPGILAHSWSDLWEGWLKFGVPLSF